MKEGVASVGVQRQDCGTAGRRELPDRGPPLARRSLSDPNDLAYDLALAPTEVTLQGLATVAATRSTAEPCLEEAKGETGLDQHQVRHWPSRYRHLTRSMPAHAWLAAIRHRLGAKGGCPPGLAGSTVPEVRRLPVALPLAAHSPELGLVWSWWRRAKRQHPRCRHYRRRALQGRHDRS